MVHCFFFFYYTFDVLWLFHIRCFVSSSERKNQIVVTIGTLLHHILCEFYRIALLAFHSVCYVLFRDKRGSLRQENGIKSRDKTQT